MIFFCFREKVGQHSFWGIFFSYGPVTKNICKREMTGKYKTDLEMGLLLLQTRLC